MSSNSSTGDDFDLHLNDEQDFAQSEAAEAAAGELEYEGRVYRIWRGSNEARIRLDQYRGTELWLIEDQRRAYDSLYALVLAAAINRHTLHIVASQASTGRWIIKSIWTVWT